MEPAGSFTYLAYVIKIQSKEWYWRIFQGVLLSVPEVCTEVEMMKRLWVHEVLRVYYDRLVDDKDRDWLIQLVKDVTKNLLKEDFYTLFQHLDDGKKGDVSQ